MSELTNLLSHDRIRALAREYFLRLGTVSALLVSVLVVVHGALLVPSYLYLREEVHTRAVHLASITKAFASSEEQEVDTRLTKLSENANAILTLSNVPTGSAVLQSVLQVPHEHIRITGFTVSRVSAGEGTMRLMGVADTREALRRYHQALSNLPFVSKADLPLSVYAQEADISFSIALSGTLTP